jgi:hypothetical protein
VALLAAPAALTLATARARAEVKPVPYFAAWASSGIPLQPVPNATPAPPITPTPAASPTQTPGVTATPAPASSASPAVPSLTPGPLGSPPPLPAGVVPSDVTVELGGTVSPQFAAAKIEAAIAAGAQLRPGARAVVRDVTPGDTLRPGETLEALGHVHLDGAGAFANVDGTTSVHLKVDSLARLDPDLLFYSDDPERLEADDDGVLFRGSLDPATPVRAYVYHVAGDAPHKLFLVFSATAGEAQVQILGASAGPSNAFGYVGHLSTVNYLLVRGAQESSVVTVEADRPYVFPIARELQPGELVAGIFDARVLSGGPVELAVVSTSGDADPADEAADPELAGDGHGRRGEFDLTTLAPLALTYVAGAPDPEPFTVGTPTIPNVRPGGRPLGGDYGALRDVSLKVNNPGAVPATVYFYESPAGGSATTTIWFTGDPRPTEIACVIRPNRYTIKAIDLAPGEMRVVTGEYMTDGTSSFPLLFGLTSTPPSPPPGPYDADACNPRPAPSASSSASPGPAATTAVPATPTATPVPAAATATPVPLPTQSGS